MGCCTSKQDTDIPLSDVSNKDVLEHTPPSKLKPYKVENGFWDHKKKLIPDYSKMEPLDKRALQAPPSLKQNPKQLVDYLVKGLNSDLEKARVLMRWIGNNVAYDVEYLRTGKRGDYSIEAVLRTGRAVCQGYSDLLVHFCGLANVKCEAISGLSKGASYYPGYEFDTNGNDRCAHAWNKVEIKGKWYLCDSTWAAGAVGDSAGQKKFEKKWNEAWFLTHPEAFLSTHMPFKANSGVIASEQLVQKPVSSLETWNNQVSSDPMMHAYNIKPISHLNGVIKTKSAEVSITFSNPNSNAMKQWTELRQQGGRQELDNRVMIYTVGSKVHVDVRLPGKGSYILKILGKVLTPEWPNAKEDVPLHKMFLYKIDCEASKPREGFIPSGSDPGWGIESHYQAAGFQLTSPQSPVIEVKNGLCQIQMKLPTSGVFPTFHRLHHPQANTKELEPCVYGEKDGNKATYYIRCPYVGEYRFEIMYKPAPDTGSGGFYTGAAFLLKCQKAAQDAFCYTDCDKLGGPLPAFYTKFNLKSTASCSTLKAQGGKATLVIEKTRPVKVFAQLKSGKGQEKSVESNNSTNSTTFNIEVPGAGYHFFQLFACEENQRSGSHVATYCVTG